MMTCRLILNLKGSRDQASYANVGSLDRASFQRRNYLDELGESLQNSTYDEAERKVSIASPVRPTIVYYARERIEMKSLE